MEDTLPLFGFKSMATLVLSNRVCEEVFPQLNEQLPKLPWAILVYGFIRIIKPLYVAMQEPKKRDPPKEKHILRVAF